MIQPTISIVRAVIIRAFQQPFFFKITVSLAMIAKQDMTVSGLIYVDKLFKSRVLKVLTLDLIKSQSKFHLIHKHYDNYGS